MTRQRRIILEELSTVRTHPTADEVHRMVRRRMPNISLGTVYRNLELLASQGAVKMLEHGTSKKRFDYNISEHYHVRCGKCGQTDDLDVRPLKSLKGITGETAGYEITGYSLEFEGICPDCRKPKKGAGGGTSPRSVGMRWSGKDKLKADALEELYGKYNHREYVHPDPLEFLYAYQNPRDREIVGLIASSLAYGRVAQILRNVSWILERIPQPYMFLQESTPGSLRKTFRGFKHRFTSGDEVAGLLDGVRRVIQKYGSLEELFVSGLRDSDGDIPQAIDRFVRNVKGRSCARCDTLLPNPSLGSACKRLNLYLRWMVRRDEVDMGGWARVPAGSLIVPLDVHLHRIGIAMGLTDRKQADMRTAVQLTESFKKFSPSDPVKYDFSLTRLGIRDDLNCTEFFRQCGIPSEAGK